MTKRYLTKSRFKMALECPTKLFYTGKDELYRDTRAEDPFLEALAEGGFQVGTMAKLLFPDGIEVTVKDNSDALSHTRSILNQYSEVVLFEPAFAVGNLLVRVDILVKKEQYVELIEVKAKSYDSKSPKAKEFNNLINPEIRSYIEDVAFQRYVVSKALPQADIRCFLLLPDKSVSARIDRLNQFFKVRRRESAINVVALDGAYEAVQMNAELLAKVPIDKFVEAVMANSLAFPGSKLGGSTNFEHVVSRFASAYEEDKRIPPVLNSNCASCEFRDDVKGHLKSGYHECLQEAAGLSYEEVEKGTVLDLWNYRRKDDLLSKGVVLLSQVSKEHIGLKDEGEGLSNSRRQWLQANGIPREDDKGGYYFDSNLFAKKISQWRYPFHMIDFETCTVALPFFAGMRPYESIAFQFSHHVIHADGRIEHKDQALFTKPGEFPNFEFLRSLMRAIAGDMGSIFRWGTHENTILKQIKRQLETAANPPDDKNKLVQFIDEVTDAGNRSMIDLNRLAQQAYFAPKTKGRTSIKKVLPAVMASSTFLQEKYSLPIYGTQIPSLNFHDGFAWYQEVGGEPKDPYERLKNISGELSQTIVETDSTLREDAVIAEGGSAAIAYARLQFEDLSVEARSRVESALLRYCELDTFAMVMIVEAWADWSTKYLNSGQNQQLLNA